MDLSDGLADAIRQIATASGTGATVDAAALPIDPAAAAWFAARAEDPVLSALSGGDDYELLFTVPKKRRGRFRGVERHAQGLPLTRIGELTDDRGLRLSRGQAFEPIPEGFTHFSTD
jgi:thiamine-monophosphate kinase